MRTRIGWPFVAVIAAVGFVGALVGCATNTQAGTPNGPGSAGDNPGSTSDARANGHTVCQAARKTSDGYLGTILDTSGTSLATQTQEWAADLSADARQARETSLQTALFGLSDVVRGWASRPPDRVAVSGFRHDLDSACQPYLADASASS